MGSKNRGMASHDHALLGAGAVLLGILTISGIHPFDRTTWFLEVLPVLVVLPILVATRRRYPLTPLLYGAIFVHACVLIGGGAYSYARVPLGSWVQQAFHLERNPYDKLGHFLQGLVPALTAREILTRGARIRGQKTLAFVVFCIAMTGSALYELVEWASALTLGKGADEFLGTQGDPWDTQSDMLFALLGAITALIVFSRSQDRQITSIERATSDSGRCDPS